MFLELIATFAAGVGAAGFALVLNMMTRGRLPKWVMPVFAGLAMIGVGVSNEYTWGKRTTAGLPEGIIVTDRTEHSSWYRPWSYMSPVTNRLVALDQATMQTNPDIPDIKLADVYLFERWRAPIKVPQFLRCTDGMRAEVTDVTLADPDQAIWRPASQNLISAACREA